MSKKINGSIVAVALLALLSITSCKKNDAGGNGIPVVKSFTPTQGGGTTEILITGDNFSSDISQLSVSINGNPLKIVNANNGQIMAIVPPKAGSGPVVVVKRGQTAVSTDTFTYVYNRVVSTFAGSGTYGYANGSALNASFDFTNPSQNWFRSMGIVADNAMNIYVDDPGNFCIRKIDTSGNVTLFAGTPGNWSYGDGGRGVAAFRAPYGLAIDKNNNLYCVDPVNWDIREITPDGNATTIGWGAGAPWGVAVNPVTSEIYYTATDAGCVYRLNADGSNTQIASGLSYPAGIACDSSGNVYVSLNGDNTIIRLEAGTWNSTVIAGIAGTAGYVDGAGTSAEFSYPWGLGIDGQGNIYVAGNGTWNGSTSNADQAIRLIEAGSWKVSTFAGSGTAGYTNGVGAGATFSAPGGVTVDKNGTVYVIDKNNNVIRKIISL